MGNIKTPYDRVFIKTDEEITLPEKQALIGRLEKFLYAICAFDFDDLPIPQSRIEKFVFALISGEIPDIVPQSRAEKFLLAYLTGDMSDLPEPQSRIELLLNNLVFGIQDISNVETIQSRYELLMAYLVQHNEGSNVEPTYHTLTIKYVDVNGNELRERYVEENIKTGTIYNVSHLDDEIEIEDYQYVRTDGDKTTGVMTKDREIIVVYKLKEYDLTIKYQDENGNTIHTSYTETLEKGTSYDVSHLDDEIEIEGYVYLRTDGDSLIGIMDGNKEIIVIYETAVIDIFYNLTIKYVDTNGNEIFNKYEIESIKEGLNYDVSHLDNEIVIDGYKYVKTEGDSLTGIMDGNKEIIVVYKKLENYNLIIKYQDEDGNTLIDDYEEVIQEDNFYDVSHLDDEVLINGYTYLSVEGDSLSGVMDGNKEIIVVYEIDDEYILYDFSEENYILYNTVEKPVKSAILKGNTKYRDIDTGDILDTFDETKNLELVSVKMPVLTTTGKNLFDVNKFKGIGIDEDGYYVPTKFVDSTDYVTLKLKPNMKYTVSAVRVYDGTTSFMYRIENNGNYRGLNTDFNTDATGVVNIRIGGNKYVFSDTSKVKEIMIVESTLNNIYEPFKSNILSCQLAPLNQSMFEQGTFAESTPPNTQSYEDIKLGSEHLYTTRIRTKGTYKVVQGATYEGQLNDGYGIFICYCKNGLYSAKDEGWIDKTNFTFTVPNDCDEMFFVLRKTDNSAITPSDYPLIGLKIHQEVVLRSLPNGVKDTLNLNTGEYVQRIGEIVLDGGENWVVDDLVFNNTYRFDLTISNIIHKNWGDIVTQEQFVKSNVFKSLDLRVEAFNLDTEHLTGWDFSRIVLNVNKAKLSENSVNALKTYLQQNPITVQYQLATESIKTVDLSVVNQDGNNTKLSTFNDITHVTLSSEELIPEAELEVATKNEEVLNTMSLEMDDISTTQTALEETSNTQSENVDATMMATTEIYEQLL